MKTRTESVLGLGGRSGKFVTDGDGGGRVGVSKGSGSVRGKVDGHVGDARSQGVFRFFGDVGRLILGSRFRLFALSLQA